MSRASRSQIVRSIPVLIAGCLFALPAQAKYSGGTGEPNDPHQIATAADLIALGETPVLQTYYVAPDGLDSNPGTKARPWKTIHHATQTIGCGDTVVVMSGVYRVSGPLEFGPAGESFERMTTYRCEEGARAIFSMTNDRPPGAWLRDYVRVEGLWLGGKWEPPEVYGAYIGVGGGSSPIGRGKQLVNCTIFGYNDGILLGQSEDLLIYGNRFVHTGSGWYQHGIYLSGGAPPGRCSNHAIVDNNIFIHGEGYAIHGQHGPKSVIVTRNFISRHYGGITMDGSDHLIANNLIWRCGPDDEGGRGGTGICLAGEHIVAINNIFRECSLCGYLARHYLERNAGLNVEGLNMQPPYAIAMLLTVGNEQADFGVRADEIDEAVARLGEIFDQPVEILYQDQRIEPLFGKLHMTIADGSCLKDTGRAWYDLDKTVNIGPDIDQPACLNTLWYAFRKWGLKDWDDSWNVYESSPPWWGNARTPDSRDNDGDGIPNDSDPDDDNDGVLDEYDMDRDGDGVQDTAETILAKDPDDKGSVPPIAPSLELSQDMIVVHSVYGRDPPGVVILSISNRGVDTADWQVLLGEPWVEASPSKGSLGAGIMSPLTVGFRTQTLPVGVYSTHMTFTCGLQTLPVPVQLEVLDESVIEQGLLHHWTFDEGQGNMASDKIGGAHGTIYGAEWIDGITGHALGFDGIDGYVDIPELADDFSQFTVSLWFTTVVPGTPGYVESFSDNTMWQRYTTGGGDGGEMSLATVNGRLRGEFNLVQTGDARSLYSDALVTDGQWHHAAMTVSAKDRIVLFLDGRQVDERNIQDDAEAINASHDVGSGRQSIGRSAVWWLATTYYTGAIDDVRSYGRPLCPAEIEVMYHNVVSK